MNKSIIALLAIVLIILSSCAGSQPAEMDQKEDSADEPPQPDDQSTVVCTADVHECEDGTYVSRVGPDCDFAPCPEEEAAAQETTTAPETSEESEESSLPGPENEETEQSSPRGLDSFSNDTYVVNRNGIDMLQDLVCDLKTHMFSVSVVIPADSSKTYTFKRESAFTVPEDVALSRLSINGKQIRDLESFCDGQYRIAPGEQVSCEFPFVENEIVAGVMIRTGDNDFDTEMSNRVHLSSAYEQSEVEFICK